MHTFLKTVLTTSLVGIMLAGCTAQTTVISTPTPVPTVEPTSAPVSQPFSIKLKTVKTSGQSGTATFEDVGGGKTKVTLELVGKPSTVNEPAHIHTGTCAKPGNVLYPLSDVVDGKSITIVNASIPTIVANGQTLVNVHKSSQESTVYMACGELPDTMAKVAPSPVATGAPSTY